MKEISPSPYQLRMAKLRACLDTERVEALLVTSLPNVHYLTGFSGSAGVLLATMRESSLITDPRYDLQAHDQVSDSRVIIVNGDALKAAAKQANRSRFVRLGFESGAVTFETHKRLKELFPSKRLVPTSGWVETLRIEKDEGEIEQIRQAVALSSRAFSETVPLLKPGILEMEVAAEIEYRMRRYGAEQPSFETIVAFGPRTALPHARAGARALQPGECILMDLGAILKGYVSDMTRTVFLGKPSAKAARMYQAVLEAQKEAEETVRAGVECAAVDRAARRVLERYGYERFFTHSTGHGVGREIHELPRIGKKQRTLLPERAVITVEPGVYLAGFGGVRIEDVVVVRKDGPEVLTQTPKELTVL
jgi:Xaa-Pro aminopeptidase